MRLLQLYEKARPISYQQTYLPAEVQDFERHTEWKCCRQVITSAPISNRQLAQIKSLDGGVALESPREVHDDIIRKGL